MILQSETLCLAELDQLNKQILLSMDVITFAGHMSSSVHIDNKK